MSNWFTRLFTGGPQSATEAPLAATVPDDWKNGSEAAYSGVTGHGEDWGIEPTSTATVKLPVSALSDADVLTVLAESRAQATYRTGPNSVRTVQYGENMQQVPKPIMSSDDFGGDALLSLMRR